MCFLQRLMQILDVNITATTVVSCAMAACFFFLSPPLFPSTSNCHSVLSLFFGLFLSPPPSCPHHSDDVHAPASNAGKTERSCHQHLFSNLFPPSLPSPHCLLSIHGMKSGREQGREGRIEERGRKKRIGDCYYHSVFLEIVIITVFGSSYCCVVCGQMYVRSFSESLQLESYRRGIIVQVYTCTCTFQKCCALFWASLPLTLLLTLLLPPCLSLSSSLLPFTPLCPSPSHSPLSLPSPHSFHHTHRLSCHVSLPVQTQLHLSSLPPPPRMFLMLSPHWEWLQPHVATGLTLYRCVAKHCTQYAVYFASIYCKLFYACKFVASC